jgi:hypothetical protein
MHVIVSVNEETSRVSGPFIVPLTEVGRQQ